MIAAVHAAAARRGLDETARRALQERLTGHASCAQMTETQLAHVLDHLHGRARPARPRPAPDRAPLIAKIYALLGARPVAYAEGILARMYGHRAPARLEWADSEMLRKVVAALEYDRRRHG